MQTHGLVGIEHQDALDGLVARALQQAALRARPEPADKSFLEKRLVVALREALTYFAREELILCDKKLRNCELPGWDPQPGTIDVAIVNTDLEPRIAFELKVDDIEWTLWDIYKMVSATTLPTVEAAYVVVAGRPGMWAGTRNCVELFDLDYVTADCEEWYSRFLFAEYKRAWNDLLNGGTGRLHEIPSSIRLTAIGKWTIPSFSPHELRAIRVEAVESARPPVTFAEGWPIPPVHPRGMPNYMPTTNLQVSDLPAADAVEHDYHSFALTFNGYEQMGSFRRCARLANKAAETWRVSGTLPTRPLEIRACLFFEQRRFHHFGHGFDERTLAYVRALVETLRDSLESGGH